MWLCGWGCLLVGFLIAPWGIGRGAGAGASVLGQNLHSFLGIGVICDSKPALPAASQCLLCEVVSLLLIEPRARRTRAAIGKQSLDVSAQ